MAVQIQSRRDTAANWTTNDPTLAAGEIGLETDTGKLKIGDGATAWTALNYIDSAVSHDSIADVSADDHHVAFVKGDADLLYGDIALEHASGSDDQVAGDFNHDDLANIPANDHIDWTADQGATNINAGNYTDTTYTSSDFSHNSLAGLNDGDSYEHITQTQKTALHAESHNIASHSDTTATGAELDDLTDNSMADTLHRHSELSASDGTPDRALVVDATGNVGIGTTAPGAKLDVAGTSDTTGNALIFKVPESNRAAITDNIRIYNAYQAPNWNINSDDGAVLAIGTRGGSPGFLSMVAKGSVYLATRSGNVGIGDTTPSQKLDVNGTVRADDFVEFSQPIPTEEAMPIIMGMKNKEDGTLDHKTFPKYTKKEIVVAETKDEDGKVLEEAKTITKESVSLSAQVKYLIKAVQELNAKIETFK